MTLGENVKALREALGLTYDAVGSAVGTDGQNIFNLEKRKSKVSKFSAALAQFFGVDLTLLLTGDLTAKSPDELRAFCHSSAAPSLRDGGKIGEEVEPARSDDLSAAIRILSLFEKSTASGKKFILKSAETAEKISSVGSGRIGNNKAQ